MKKQDMNLLARYNELNKTKASQYSDNKLYFILVAVVVLIFGAYSVKLFLDQSLLNKDIEQLEKYVFDTNIQSRLNYVNQLENDIAQIDEILLEIASINQVFDSTVRFNSVPISVLDFSRPQYVQLESINYQNGAAMVVISGRTASDISNYVLRLQRTNHFKRVTYSGYTYDEGLNRYFATIQCLLKGGL